MSWECTQCAKYILICWTYVAGVYFDFDLFFILGLPEGVHSNMTSYLWKNLNPGIIGNELLEVLIFGNIQGN